MCAQFCRRGTNSFGRFWTSLTIRSKEHLAVDRKFIHIQVQGFPSFPSFPQHIWDQVKQQQRGRADMFTVRPASLLCRFIADRASGRFSLASANSLDTSTPNSASSLQPPHFQPSPGGPLWWVSQPHMVDVPSAQERVTAYATPADAMAWTNADSRVAETDKTKTDRKRERETVCQTWT